MTTGITVDKKGFQDQMVAYAIRTAGALMAYASANSNNTLLAKAKLSERQFERLRDDQRDALARDMHDEADASSRNWAPGVSWAAGLTTRCHRRLDRDDRLRRRMRCAEHL